MGRNLLCVSLALLLLTGCLPSTGPRGEDALGEPQSHPQDTLEEAPPHSGEGAEDTLPDWGEMAESYYGIGELDGVDRSELGGGLLMEPDSPWAQAEWDLSTLCVYYELDRNFTAAGGPEEWARLPKPFFSCLLYQPSGAVGYCVFFVEEGQPKVHQVVETPEPYDLEVHLERILWGLDEWGVDVSTVQAMRGHCYDTEDGGTCEGILLLCGPRDPLRLFYNFEQLVYRGEAYPPGSLIERRV